MKENILVREKIKCLNLKHWQIALTMGISEQTLVRWLRVPLSPEKEKAILMAITKLSEGAV